METGQFDPNSYQNIPHPNIQLLDPGAFSNPADYQKAELAARESIRAAISHQNGGVKVYAKHELVAGKGQKSQRIFDDIQSGAIVR